MKTTLLAVAFAAVSLASFSASAQSFHPAQPVPPGPQHCPQMGLHQAPPPPHPVFEPRGHYVTQNVQQWVDGRYEQVSVPLCRPTRWHHARCFGERLENRYVPGHYVTVAQQVWVDDGGRDFGRGGDHRHDHHMNGAVSYRD